MLTAEKILEAAAQLEDSRDSSRRTAASNEGLGLYRCWRPQEVRDVVLPEASALLVLRGRKQLATPSHTWLAGAGELLLVPAETTFWLGNYPDDSGRSYRGVAVRFSTEVIELFRQLYGPELDPDGHRDRWHARAPEEFLDALEQWLSWCHRQVPDALLARHRRVELLLLLARAGLAGNLLLSHHPSWGRRVRELLLLDPAHPWRMEEMGGRLGVSESTLRRHLQDEGQGFRSLLEEVRLAHGLTLVQESGWPIGRIADAVGYRSQSRFSERFKRRYGLTPRDLRHTQDPERPIAPPKAKVGESSEMSAD